VLLGAATIHSVDTMPEGWSVLGTCASLIHGCDERLAHLWLGFQDLRKASILSSDGVNFHTGGKRRRPIDHQALPIDILL
jgi:hypothetical protein